MLDTHIDESMADIYDVIYPDSPSAGATADFVVALCPDGGSILELGVGTGRIALRMAGRDRRVTGMDNSRRMLDRLRDRDPHGSVTTVLGDFTRDVVDAPVDVVLLAINTLFALPTQDLQVAAFQRIGEQLAPGGVAVFETFDPARMLKSHYPTTASRPVADGTVAFSTVVAHFPSQTVVADYTVFDGDGIRTGRETGRYVWPTEMDLMARVAGLRLRERWSGWSRQPVPDEPFALVSVYEKEGS